MRVTASIIGTCAVLSATAAAQPTVTATARSVARATASVVQQPIVAVASVLPGSSWERMDLPSVLCGGTWCNAYAWNNEDGWQNEPHEWQGNMSASVKVDVVTNA